MQDLKDRCCIARPWKPRAAFRRNVLTTVHDANIGSIFGIGFPGWTGGAMQFIYGTGLDAFCKRAAELATSMGRASP
jgi:3-hydroxyacyl-CoA dehydrogenase/enoyl-CoA hydratase/3-hydroxybutyryl-CoA epimerase